MPLFSKWYHILRLSLSVDRKLLIQPFMNKPSFSAAIYQVGLYKHHVCAPRILILF